MEPSNSYTLRLAVVANIRNQPEGVEFISNTTTLGTHFQKLLYAWNSYTHDERLYHSLKELISFDPRDLDLVVELSLVETIRGLLQVTDLMYLSDLTSERASSLSQFRAGVSFVSMIVIRKFKDRYQQYRPSDNSRSFRIKKYPYNHAPITMES